MHKCSDGHPGRAARVLVSGKILPFDGSRAIVELFQRLHPPASDPMPALPANTLMPTALAHPEQLQEIVRKQLANGSGPGPSGWTGELIKGLMADEDCAYAVCKLVSDMCCGRLQTDRCRALLLSSRLIPLQKTNESGAPDGMRPIAVLEAFYRLACLFALRLCNVSDAFRESAIQFGVARPGGSERAFHRIQSQLEFGNEHTVALSTDIENAFNSRRRAAIARSVYSDERFKCMYRLFDWSYGLPTDLLVFDRSERVATFSSAEGVRQGDPLASVAFALSMERHFDAAVRAGNVDGDNEAKCVGVAVQDDFTVVGHQRAVLRAYDGFMQECAREGIRLRPDKCRLLYPHRDAAPNELVGACTQRGLRVVTDGMKVVGGMITFNDEAVRRRTIAQVTKQSAMFDALCHDKMRSSVAYRIGQVCGVPKVNYLTQITPPMLAVEAMQRWDEKVATFVEKKIVQLDESKQLTVVAKHQIRLPVREGGLGFTQASQAHSRFLLSALQCVPDMAQSDFDRLLATVHPPTSRFNGVVRHTIFDHMIRAFTVCRTYDTTERAYPVSFSELLRRVRADGCVSDELRATFARMLTHQRQALIGGWPAPARARIMSASAKGASMFLVVTSDRPEYFLHDSQFVAAIRHRLGERPYDDMPALCECGTAFARLEHDHFHTCRALRKRGPGVRHDEAVFELAKICRMATMADNDVTVEPRSSQSGENKRPDIHAFLRHSVDGRPRELWIDLSVTTPSAASFYHSASTTKLVAATRREAHKINKYASFMRHEEGKFIPFVMESYGAFGTRCREVIGILARHAVRIRHDQWACEADFKRMAFRRMAFALQRGNHHVAAYGVERAYHRRSASGGDSAAPYHL